ncbi:ATP-binding protein [Sulfuracidifex metallicus]|uniref:ATP-binding protein n=1 Tax=Sulfuracidifex metallicus TaxID=47303 RepID=UPI002275A680|nr:ATP-binding protein [Sulfuracidifex metallicus]MCY0850058.1 ATP-binding protein [Sulfuracidifex metallicus]
MDREKVLKALMDWNFWYKEQFTGYTRNYSKQVLDIMKSGFVADVIGVKRSGKSTIFNQAISRLIKEEKINPFLTLLINFEDSRFAEIDNAEKLFSLLQIYREETGINGKPYIFLDEAQKVRGWEGFVRSLIDRKEAYVAVSGSTSVINKGRVREVLAGRHISVEVLPLSFSEYLKFRGVQVEKRIDLLAQEEEIKKLFLEFLKFSGFPAVVNSSMKDKILLSLYDDIISKDVINSCKIRQEVKLRELSLFYISNVGNRISFRKISRSLNIPLNTVERFTSCLLDSLIIYFVPPLSPSLKEMVKGEKKVYSVDQGLSNVVGYKLNESLGSLLENAVYLELRRRYGWNSIFYYRGKNEVDFLIKVNNEVRYAYQVAFTLSDEREIKGLKELERKGDNKKKIKKFIITFDDEEKEIDGIRLVKSWKWMLSLSP